MSLSVGSVGDACRLQVQYTRVTEGMKKVIRFRVV